jgi:hypothetical protein
LTGTWNTHREDIESQRLINIENSDKIQDCDNNSHPVCMVKR